MKLRKTRLKKETKANGAVVYTAQYRSLFEWFSFDDYDGRMFMFEIWCDWSETVGKLVGHTSEEQAKSIIDFYISRVQHKNASAIENEIVKTEYEKYP